MTSIEWFYNELIEHKIIKKEKHFTFVKNFATTYELLFEQAKKMHDEEMATNCRQPVKNYHGLELSAKEISKQANIHGYEEHSFLTASTSNQKRLSFYIGAKWVLEQLKNR